MSFFSLCGKLLFSIFVRCDLSSWCKITKKIVNGRLIGGKFVKMFSFR